MDNQQPTIATVVDREKEESLKIKKRKKIRSSDRSICTVDPDHCDLRSNHDDSFNEDVNPIHKRGERRRGGGERKNIASL